MERPNFETSAHEPEDAFLPDLQVHKEVNPIKIREAVERAIENIDFRVLSAIFEEERKRARVKDVSKFRGPENIHVAEENLQGIRGLASYNGPYLEIRPGEIFESMQRRGKGIEDIPQIILSILSHEETHAVADNGHGFDGAKFVAKMLIYREAVFSRSGYDSLKKVGWKLGSQFSLFNEGVTELLAEEIFAEYVRRTGTLVTHTPSGSGYFEFYQGPRAVVKTFIAALAEATGLPYDTVWNSIKEGYFTNKDLSGNEIYKAFQEVGLRDFVEKMRAMDFTGKTSPLAVLSSFDFSRVSFPPEVVADLKRAIGAYAEKPAGENRKDIEKLSAFTKSHSSGIKDDSYENSGD